jgi:glycosyltransferase involved in cell wall biosynthesis
MNPKVTILITVKNAVKTIDMCMMSLLDLGYPTDLYEIMVVDAFSNDETWEHLEKFASSYPNRVKIFQKKGYPPVAYNFAMDKINSDYVALIDGDCVAAKDWLIELLRGFSDKTSAVAGIALNPPHIENKFQELIGKELENRYRKFPKIVSRAATMNLMIKTAVLKNFRFDERLFVSYDTDWGYTLTENGYEIRYNEKAIVYHYHRATWKSYFRQQFNYAKYAPFVYWKHRGMGAKGDHVSTSSMLAQPFLLGFSLLFLLLSILSLTLILVSYMFAIILLGIWIININNLTKNLFDSLRYLAIFFVRSTAWLIGLFFGVFNLISKIKKRLVS